MDKKVTFKLGKEIKHKFWMVYTIAITYMWNDADDYKTIEYKLKDTDNLAELIAEIRIAKDDHNIPHHGLKESEYPHLYSLIGGEGLPYNSESDVCYKPDSYNLFYYDDQYRKYEAYAEFIKT